VVEFPMFNCYALVRIVQTVDERLKVLRTPGAFGFVGKERNLSRLPSTKIETPIPEEQIESLRIAIREKIPRFPDPFISTGKRVRIPGRSVDGIEGIPVRQVRDRSLIVPVELLRQPVSIRLEGFDIELV
jgi:transcription antitermination factor NusG